MVLRFAILVVLSQSHQEAYYKNLRNIECYSRIQKYTFRVIEPGRKCTAEHSEFMFQRHCEVADFMERERGRIDWVLFLDADHAVVNMNHTLDKYTHAHKHIIHGLRFHNNEVMAGYYLAKNTAYATKFLRDWARLDSKYRQVHAYSGMNLDNGALHWHLLRRLAGSHVEGWSTCMQIGKDGKNYAAFRACFHHVLARTRCRGYEWDKIGIVPRGKHVAYDGWVTYYKWSSSVFMHHAMKNPPITSSTCCRRPLRGRMAPRVRSCSNRTGAARLQKDDYYTTDSEIASLFKETELVERPKHFGESYMPQSCVQDGSNLWA